MSFATPMTNGPMEVRLSVSDTAGNVGQDKVIVTAGGVSSSLDLGLYLVEKYWGSDARVRIANQMEYRGYSPA